MEILTIVVILLTVILLLFLLSMIWPPDSPWSPWWRTNNKTAKALCKVAQITEKDYLIDLGCGDGEVLITAARHFGATGLGVEIDPFRAYFASIKVQLFGLSKKVHIKRQNLFETELKDATVIVVYLVPKTLERLGPRLKKLKKGTRVVSYMYQIPFLKLSEKDSKSKLYVYTL